MDDFLLILLGLVAFSLVVWILFYLSKLEKLRVGNKQQKQEYRKKIKVPSKIAEYLIYIVLTIISGGWFLLILLLIKGNDWARRQ